ncbi:MAG: MBL fold metallo-hydrolase [Desulfobacterales bacterium]
MKHLDRLNHSSQKYEDVRLTLLYDSMAHVRGLKTGWGFSCLVEVGETTLLFDTGGDGNILLSNMKKLGVNPKAVQIVLLSHNRAGHIGGLAEFLQINPQVSVYIPESFPKRIIESIEKSGIEPMHAAHFHEIKPSLFTLGTFTGFFREQALAINSSMGTILVTGCAHHGVIPILQKAKEALPGKPIYLALGGFHFYGLSDSEKLIVFEAFKMLKVQKVAPCHCCEEACRLRFKKVYGHNYIEMGVGKVIRIDSTDELIKNNKQGVYHDGFGH